MLTMTQPRKKKLGGRPKVREPRKSIMSFRGSDAFAEWFQALVERERIPAASLIEKSLVSYAEQVGFELSPPKR